MPKKEMTNLQQKIPNNLSGKEAIDLVTKRDEEKKQELEEKQKKRMLENQQGKSENKVEK